MTKISPMMKSQFFILLFLVVTLSSCSRKYYSQVDEVILPNVQFPSTIQSIKILDRSRESNLSNRAENFLNTGIIHKSSTSLLNKVGGVLPVSYSVFPKSLRNSHAGSPAEVLNKNEIREYAETSDGLLCLEQYLAREIKTFENYAKHQLDENGNDYTIDAVRGTKQLSLHTLWRLYDRKTGIVVLERPYIIEEIFVEEGLTEQGTSEKLDTLHNVDPEYLNSIMVDYIREDFNPKLITSNWMYFIKGNNLIVRSGEFIKEGAFKQAISTLENNRSKYTKTKDKIRLLYNLATAMALDGQVRGAISLLENEIGRYDNKELTRLLATLKKQRRY